MPPWATPRRAGPSCTLRGVIDLAGQRVDATDRLYMAEMIPALIVWEAWIR